MERWQAAASRLAAAMRGFTPVVSDGVGAVSCRQRGAEPGLSAGEEWGIRAGPAV